MEVELCGGGDGGQRGRVDGERRGEGAHGLALATQRAQTLRARHVHDLPQTRTRDGMQRTST
eukprot:5326942-Pleurochrysis_carterae.AAC.1